MRRTWLLIAGALILSTGTAAVLWLRQPSFSFDSLAVAADRGDFSTVAPAVRHLRNTTGGSAQADVLEAILLLRGGRVEKALSLLAGVDQEGPLRHVVMRYAGESLHKLQRLGEAARVLEVLVREQPDNVEAHRWLGATWYDLGAYNAAIVELEAVVRLAPDDYRPHHLLGIMYADFEQHAESIREFTAALNGAADPALRDSMLLELAKAHAALHEYQQATACLDQAAESGTAARLRAVCLLADGQTEKADEQIRRARQLGEVSPELAVLESELLEQQGDVGKAEAVLQQAIQQWPAWAGLYYRLGNVQKQLGQDQQAETTLQTWQKYRDLATELTQLNLKAIEDPFNAEVRDRLAVICTELQKPELAEMWKTAAEACRKGTTSPATPPSPQG